MSCDSYLKDHPVSLSDKTTFFGQQALINLSWFKEFKTVYNEPSKLSLNKWFEDGELNACYNAVDRHLKSNPSKIALIHSGNDGESRYFTYHDVYSKVCEVAGVLKELGLEKGDCATIYLPNGPEICFTVLACARLGVIHNVIFGGYSADSLITRLNDSKSKTLITCETAMREAKTLNFFNIVKEATDNLGNEKSFLKNVLVFNSSSKNLHCSFPVHHFDDLKQTGVHVDCIPVSAEHPLFYLYTSGSTGKPKGLIHTTAGYLLYIALSLKLHFNFKETDIMGCTADLGWITGHSYTLYAPLLLNASTLIFDGSPVYPTPLRLFETIQQHKITHFYTAPTAIRLIKSIFASKGYDATYINNSYDLSSLKYLATVGEPINSEAYRWFSETFGNGQVPIVDTYFQTETGGFMFSPIPGVSKFIPECASFPSWGFEAFIATQDSTDEDIHEAKPGELGLLLIKGAWPGISRGIVGDQQRYEETYFNKYPGYYFTGDQAYKDENGYLWVRGRADDVLNVSGHRLSTAEIENAVSTNPNVAETAVVGLPDELTGQAVYIYSVLNKNTTLGAEEVIESVTMTLRKKIGPILRPKKIIPCNEIPKTRTGKIMRRVLRGLLLSEDLGDISTCANVACISELRQKIEPFSSIENPALTQIAPAIKLKQNAKAENSFEITESEITI